MSYVAVAALQELWDGEMTAVDVNGQPVLLINRGNTIYAYADRCAHLGVPLSQGHLEGTTLTCRAHHWQYDVTTGCGINPTSARLKPLPVKVKQDRIWVELP